MKMKTVAVFLAVVGPMVTSSVYGKNVEEKALKLAEKLDRTLDKCAGDSACEATALAKYEAKLAKLGLSTCSPPGFIAPANAFPVGAGPSSVAVSYLDVNEIQDLVVANRDSNTVSVLLGNGSGSFGPAAGFPAGNAPSGVATDHFNADGNPDLAVANQGSNTVSILLGDGSGSFGPATDYGVGSSPVSVAIDDFNGDFIPDIVTANRDSNSVSVLLGDGSGSFGFAANFPVGSSPQSVAAAGYFGFNPPGDFNTDGVADLAVANAGSNSVSVLLGNGSGGFGPAATYAVGSFPVSVAIGELNGDHDLDLVVANRDSDSVSVLFGDGSGGFGPATDFGVGSAPSAVAIRDFSGDGKPDVVVANSSSNNVSVLLNDGSGGFGMVTTFSVGSGPSALAIGNFNYSQDHRPWADVVVANAQSNTVSVLLNADTRPTSAGSIVVFENLQVDSTRDPVLSLANTTNHVARAYCFYAAQPGCGISTFEVLLPSNSWEQWNASSGNGTVPGVPGTSFSGELVCVEIDFSGVPISGNSLAGSSRDAGQCTVIATAIAGFANTNNGDNVLCLGDDISDECWTGAEYDTCPASIDPTRIEGCWSQTPLPSPPYFPGTQLNFVCGG